MRTKYMVVLISDERHLTHGKQVARWLIGNLANTFSRLHRKSRMPIATSRRLSQQQQPFQVLLQRIKVRNGLGGIIHLDALSLRL